MRIHTVVLLGTLFILAPIIPAGRQFATGEPPRSQNPGHPLKSSDVITQFQWLTVQIAYPPPGPGEDAKLLGPLKQYFEKAGYQIHGDTYPMTWADDDEIYASAGDPNWGGKNDGLDIEKFTGTPPHYTITRVNRMSDYVGYGGSGVKPSGMICVKGVLYLAFQNLPTEARVSMAVTP